MNLQSIQLAFKRLICALNRDFFLFFVVATVTVSVFFAQALISFSDEKWQVKFLLQPGQVATLSQSTLFGLFLKNQEGPTRHLTALKTFDSKNEIFQRLKNGNIVETRIRTLFPQMSNDLVAKTAALFTSSLRVVSPRDTRFLEFSFEVYDLALAEPLIADLIKEASIEQDLIITKYREQLVGIQAQIAARVDATKKQLDFVDQEMLKRTKVSLESVMISMLRENLERDYHDYTLGKADVENALQPEVTFTTKLLPNSMVQVPNPISPTKDFIYILSMCFALGLVFTVRKLGEIFASDEATDIAPIDKQAIQIRQTETNKLVEVNH